MLVDCVHPNVIRIIFYFGSWNSYALSVTGSGSHKYWTVAVPLFVKLMSDPLVGINIMVIFTKLVGQFRHIIQLQCRCNQRYYLNV